LIGWNECALIPCAPIEERSIPLRNLTTLVTLMAAAILAITLTTDSVEFFLPVIGAAAVLLFTFALAFNPTDDVRPAERRDESERHHW
jgi:hypothetical protein